MRYLFAFIYFLECSIWILKYDVMVSARSKLFCQTVCRGCVSRNLDDYCPSGKQNVLLEYSVPLSSVMTKITSFFSSHLEEFLTFKKNLISNALHRLNEYFSS